MGFKDDMADFDTQWEEDQANPNRGGARLGDGPHQAMIVESRIEHDKTEDTYTWIQKFQNTDGSIRKWYNLDHEVGRSIAAGDSAMMGYEGKLSDLEDWLIAEEPIGLVCEINVKTKPGTGDRDFTNVYVNRVLGKADPGDFGGLAGDGVGSGGGNQFVPAGGTVPAADDDIPF